MPLPATGPFHMLFPLSAVCFPCHILTVSQVALLFSQRVSMNKSVACGVRVQTQALRTASLLLHLPLPH